MSDNDKSLQAKRTSTLLKRLKNNADDGSQTSIKARTFALIMASAMATLRAVRAAHEENPSLSSKMPYAWKRLLRDIRQFDRDFGNAIDGE